MKNFNYHDCVSFILLCHPSIIVMSSNEASSLTLENLQKYMYGISNELDKVFSLLSFLLLTF